MSTPERAPPAPPSSEKKQIGTPKSQVEDSPVFNYISNLSPIKPVKSLHITQSFQSLSFPPVPSIFSSPHVNAQKVSKFILRPHASHPPKSDDGDSIRQGTGADSFSRTLDNNSAGPNYITSCHISNETTILPANEHLLQNSMLSLSLQYNSGSPNHTITPFYDVKSDTKLDVGSVLLIDNVPNALEESENLIHYDLVTEKSQNLEQDNEAPVCEWKAMISEDAKNLMVFDSCTDIVACNQHLEGANQGTDVSLISSSFSEENIHIPQRTRAEDLLGNFDKEVQEQPIAAIMGTSLSVEDEKQANSGIEMTDAGDCIAPCNKAEFKHQRGMLRRCLIFEMAGANRESASNGLRDFSSPSLSCQGLVSYDEKRMNTQKKNDSSPPLRMLPGIGLHLNSLASTSQTRMARKESFPYEDQITTQSSIPSFPLLLQNGEVPEVSSSIDEHQCPGSEDLALQVVCETSVETEVGKSDELSSSSPKKKRRKTTEGSNDSGSCKRCNCKKSKCLKLYCECFAAGVYCVEPCSCQDCLNKPLHEETVLTTRKQIESRNPLAFAPKVIRTSEPALESGEEANKTPASARHKRGCNCKKSNCLKKYCECFQGGAGCSISCRCEGCKNTFGTKYGKLPTSSELIESGDEKVVEHGKEEMDSCTKDGCKVDNKQSTTTQIVQQQNPEVAPITPSFPSLRLSAKLPCLSSGKPPRSTLLVIGSSPRLNSFKALQKSEVTPCQSRSALHHTAITDETPDILKSDAPSTGIKISSPSRKRVSPPHNDMLLSPRHKGSRKLILKSIPSFPSLATEASSDDCLTDIYGDLVNSPLGNEDDLL